MMLDSMNGHGLSRELSLCDSAAKWTTASAFATSRSTRSPSAMFPWTNSISSATGARFSCATGDEHLHESLSLGLCQPLVHDESKDTMFAPMLGGRRSRDRRLYESVRRLGGDLRR